jgi:hypothetical protein
MVPLLQMFRYLIRKTVKQKWGSEWRAIRTAVNTQLTCSVCKQWVLSCRFRQPRVSSGFSKWWGGVPLSRMCRSSECRALKRLLYFNLEVYYMWVYVANYYLWQHLTYQRIKLRLDSSFGGICTLGNRSSWGSCIWRRRSRIELTPVNQCSDTACRRKQFVFTLTL